MPHPPPPHSPAKKEKEMVDYRETESLFYFALCPCLQGETGVLLSHFVHDVYSAQFVWDRMMEKKNGNGNCTLNSSTPTGN